MGEAPLRIRFGDFELDENEAHLAREGGRIDVPPKAFNVLCVLLRNPGHLISKNEILDRVWGHRHVSESVLKTTISQLRTALGDDARSPMFIETVSRRGYRFIGQSSLILPLRLERFDGSGILSTLQVSSASSTQSTMTGRHDALMRLTMAWHRSAHEGKRVVFWVAGEAGIGKTTLINAFSEQISLESRVTFGQCVEQHGTGEPYLPVLEALGHLCKGDASLVEIIRRFAPSWLVQMPWLCSDDERDALRKELIGVSQDRMLREFGELLDRFTQDAPLLLVTEDLHWSDHATLDLINHVARRRGSAHLMWLASFRPAEVIVENHPFKAFRNELKLHNLCEEMLLDPFSEKELSEYASGRIARPVPDSFVKALYERTEGLPLFVCNVLDDLKAQKILDQLVDKSQSELQIALHKIPESLAGVIGRQIGRLAPEHIQVLEVASVFGCDFFPGVVARAIGLKNDVVAEIFRVLERSTQWLGEATLERLDNGALEVRYSFHHALYRHVIYERIGPLMRAKLHGVAADILQNSDFSHAGGSAAQIAYHYEHAHNLEGAVHYYVSAIEGALRQFAAADALRLSQHALRLLPKIPNSDESHDFELELNALAGVSSAQVLGVSALEARAHFQHAQSLLSGYPKHPLRSMVLHGLGLVLFVRGEFAEAKKSARASLETARRSGDAVLLVAACDLLGQINTIQGHPLEALRFLEEGLSAVESVGEVELQSAYVVDPMVTMHAVMAIPLLLSGRVSEAEAHLDKARKRAHLLQQPMAKMVAIWFSALYQVRIRDSLYVKKLAHEMQLVVDEASIAQGVGPSRWYQGWAEALNGNPASGYRKIREAYQHNTDLGMYAGAAEVLGYSTEALLLAGEYGKAFDELGEAFAMADRMEERAYIPQLLLLNYRLAQHRSNTLAAAESLLAALKEAKEQCALWSEITVLFEICSSPIATDEYYASLDAALSKLQGGEDMAFVKSAKRLLLGRN